MKKTLLIASLLVLSTACQRSPDSRNTNNPNMRSDAMRDDRGARQEGCCGGQTNGYNQGANTQGPGAYNNGQNHGHNPANAQEDDWTVNERVRDALYNDPSSPPFARAISVETRDHVVTIMGNVPTKQDADYVIRKVKGVRGVRQVNSQLTISQGQ
ncbi:MAG TPA: BON domain-containing protein [Chlamydiales bacterium]|nr:BON domain-containing protein [Chlamydiales bacterium]